MRRSSALCVEPCLPSGLLTDVLEIFQVLGRSGDIVMICILR